MKTDRLLLLLLLILKVGAAAGQQAAPGNALPGLQPENDSTQVAPALFSLPSLSVIPAGYLAEPHPRGPSVKAPRIPSPYSYEELGAFCKWEVQLEKAARLPVKFRLGEVQYVERMEGKLPDY